MQTSFPRLLVLLVVASLPAAALASNLASDNAGNYAPNSWTNGSNQGTGFGAWDLSNVTTTPGGAAGFFLGSSTPGSGNINTGGQSFGIYGNPANNFAEAQRSFTGGALSIGQTFSLQIAVNFRDGNKGFNLFAGGSQVFNFNIGGNQYTVNTGSGPGVNLLGGDYQPDSVFTLSFTQTSATTMAVSITRTSAANGTENAYSATVASAGADNFRIYVNGTGTSGGPGANDLYANNFAVIPEPSTLALLGAGCLAGVMALRRRRA